MFYKYKVSYYLEFDGSDHTDSGIVYAADYGSAANRVQHEYGRDNINDIYLKEIPIEGEYCLNKEDIDYTFNDE